MSISLKRVYEEARPEDGYRVLVDRLWPRGLTKKEARLDQWIKEAAPSDQLRQSIHRGDLTWDEFQQSYLSELEQQRDYLRELAELAKDQHVTLVYSVRNEKQNNAVVLKQYLEKLVER
jgi:uncharacterized protein YeaO (DUF488 family)